VPCHVTTPGRLDHPHPASLRIEWLRSPAEIEPIVTQWTALEAAVRNRTVLSTCDFLTTWYRHYTGAYGGAPLIGLAWHGTRLVGVAPLTSRRGRVGRVPMTRIEFAPNDSPVGEFLVEDGHPETVTAFLDSLVQVATFDVICLNGFDPASDQLPVLENAARKHRLAMELTDLAFAIADVRNGYHAYRSALSGHFRRNLNQKVRRMATVGRVVVDGVRLSEGIDAMEESIARMIAITEASHKLKGQRLADNHRGYLSELVRRFGPRGMLSLSILSVDGRDAAFLLGLVERSRFYDINLAYDESFAAFSPGMLLMQKTLEDLAASGIHTVVSHGAHDYKKHWATEFVPQKRVFLFTRGARAAAARLIRFSLAPVWRRLGRPER
jgi:CelD/BcsL family acetyltransferase involved in cellulose biosynthesis